MNNIPPPSPSPQPIGFCENLAHSVGSGLNRVWEAVKKVFVTIALVLSYPFRSLWNYCFSQKTPELPPMIIENLCCGAKELANNPKTRTAMSEMVENLTQCLLQNIESLVSEAQECKFDTHWQNFTREVEKHFQPVIQAEVKHIDIQELKTTLIYKVNKLQNTIQEEAKKTALHKAFNSTFLTDYGNPFRFYLTHSLRTAWMNHFAVQPLNEAVAAAMEAIEADRQERQLLRRLLAAALKPEKYAQISASHVFVNQEQRISLCLQECLFVPLFTNSFSNIDGMKLLGALYHHLPEGYRLSHKEFCDELNKALVTYEQADSFQGVLDYEEEKEEEQEPAVGDRAVGDRVVRDRRNNVSLELPPPSAPSQAQRGHPAPPDLW